MNTASVSPDTEFNVHRDFIGPIQHVAVSEQINEQATVAHKQSTVAQLIARFGSISSFIRVVGVGAVVLSMCLFLLDGMGVVNDTQRFFTMLMLTGLLSAGGFALAFLLKEQRGARSFFGLALLSVPINFTVLGALFYSVVQFDYVTTAYPTMAHWEILDVATLGTTVLIALVSLIPVTILGVSTMARENRAWLGTALLASSSVLLLPVRDTTWVAPIVAILVVALITMVRRCGENTVSLKTVTGRFVQALLFLPPAIMLFRSFWLYEVSHLSALVVSLTVYAAIRYASQRLQSSGHFAHALHFVSATIALSSGILSMFAFFPTVSDIYLIVIFSVVFGGLMTDLEKRVQSEMLARFLGIGTYVLLACAIALHQQVVGGFAVFLLGMLVSIVMLLVSLAERHREKMLISGIILGTVLLLNAGEVIAFFTQAGWLGFAALGGIAILMASLIDRFGPVFSLQSRRWFAARSG